jgi:hypothetical protein
VSADERGQQAFKTLQRAWRADLNRQLEVILQIVAPNDSRAIASAAIQAVVSREAQEELAQHSDYTSAVRNLLDRAGRSPDIPDLTLEDPENLEG